MTDVLDQRSSVDLDEADVQKVSSAPPSAAGYHVSLLGRIACGALLAGAAVVHFVMVPTHLDEWAAEGVAFLVAGWAQLLLAAVIAWRATPAVLRAAVALNVAFVAGWAWTRIWGAPWGPHSGVAESVGFVDAVCVGLEVAFVVAALMLLARPLTGAKARGRRAWVVAIVPIAVIGMTTAAVAAPSTRNHAHGGGDTAADEHGGTAVAGDHHAGELPAGHEDGDDKGLGMLVNGHHGDMTIKKLDAMTQAKLDGQLAVTKEVAATYPTLADAMKDGYSRQGPYSPGLGIHYGRFRGGNADGVMDREDLLNPLTIIYDGTEPTAKIAGFMYYSFAAEKPEGFQGPNDHWHYHTNTCIKPAADGLDAPLGADQEVTAEQCEAVGGSLIDRTGWMVHVWTVPGYPVDDEHGGVFGEHNPALTCPDGSYYVRPVEEWPDHPLNVCKSAS